MDRAQALSFFVAFTIFKVKINTTLSQPNPIPIIFLAFANDQVDRASYLRGLKKERDGIREALKVAERAGLCQLVERSNATIQNIIDVFQEFQDRIAIFHYGGHSNGYQLLLETLEGANSAAHSEGLVSFFAKQKNLKLIFLNGCSSQQQAIDLIEAGIPAVIGTSQSINDRVATRLAIRFYKGLAAGKEIDRSWQEAVDEAKIEKGTSNFRDFYWEGMGTSSGQPSTVAPLDRFPWEIHYKEGAESIKEWDLPEAVSNPLYGLPPIPPTHFLPQKPFLFFKRYERQHAEVFFGRASFIRKLYNLVTSNLAPPIILFYGQSGAGKSSLLDAGLLPRIEEAYEAIYVRRDASLGLVETMKKSLHQRLNRPTDFPSLLDIPKINPPSSPPSSTLIEELLQLAKRHPSYSNELKRLANQAKQDQKRQEKKQEITGIAGLWHRVEEQTGKPLIFILDQVEEMFTHPHEQLNNEGEDFFGALHTLFGTKQLCPKGRLMLAFRKEFTAEIERDMSNAQLPFSKVFLTKLERPNIIEAITGLTSTEQLRTTYNIQIDENLPVIIADDLLEDQDSPIAPVLQILLTKMWDKATEANAENPHFSETLYQQIKDEGLLMDDFLNQQLKKLSQDHSTYVESGLVLDLLHFHTTKRRTSASQEEKSVLARYEDKAELVATLLHELTKLCLLVPVRSGVRKLTHDTLAQIVNQKFHESVTPGQRAMRILTYKMLDYEAGEEVLLDSSDLRIIEAGLAGMRKLSPKEEELIQRSREEIERRTVVQARKDAEIVFFRERSEEKEVDTTLLRLLAVMEEESQKKHPRHKAIAHAAYQQYPDHPGALRLVYALLPKITPQTAPVSEYTTLFEQDNGDLLALDPDENFSSPLIPSFQADWHVKVSFPAAIEIIDEAGEISYEFNVIIRDYGLLLSLVMLPDNIHFVLCTTDGLVMMYNLRAEKVFEIGDRADEAHPYESAVCDPESNELLLKKGESVEIYPLHPSVILNPLEIPPLSASEKRAFDMNW
ncbi:MAG: CHAT domain-containing protein [Flammeovirgaceae bacterium]